MAKLNVSLTGTGSTVMEVLNPDEFPASMRRAIEARNIANASGRCPICGEVRRQQPEAVANAEHPALLLYHDNACPASDGAIWACWEEAVDLFNASGVTPILDMRLDPEHAREAGYNVQFSQPSQACDFCLGSIAHRLQLRPTPYVLANWDTILFLAGEWCLCKTCYKVRRDAKQLMLRQKKAHQPLWQAVPKDDLQYLIVMTAAIGVAFERAQKPYRERDDALGRLEHFRMALLRGDYLSGEAARNYGP
jgi:hypothetical protein